MIQTPKVLNHCFDTTTPKVKWLFEQVQTPFRLLAFVSSYYFVPEYGRIPHMGKGKLIQNRVHLETHEYNTVKFLLTNGYDVELIPPSKIKHLQMPDIILQGVPWEMKSPVEAGKYTIKNIVQNTSHQSVNIIIDLRRCKMMDDEAIRKIRHYFDLSKRIRRVKIITKTAEIIDVSK